MPTSEVRTNKRARKELIRQEQIKSGYFNFALCDRETQYFGEEEEEECKSELIGLPNSEINSSEIYCCKFIYLKTINNIKYRLHIVRQYNTELKTELKADYEQNKFDYERENRKRGKIRKRKRLN